MAEGELSLPECATCRAEAPGGATFCMSCGAPVAGRALRRAGVRKVVTVLFSDVTGFTQMGEQLDPEALHEVMERYYGAMREVVQRHGGRVERFIGDAVMGSFGLPRAHEDDAVRAARAAVEIGEALVAVNSRLPPSLGVHLTASTGVNTGEVFVGEEVLGDAVNVAARLEGAAAPGEILLGELTYRLARGSVEAERLDLELKGKSERVAAFRLVRVASPSERLGRRLTAPMVGRGREAAQLASAFEEASKGEACTLVTVLGLAGTGKSRLVADALASFQDRARVLSGRCLPYGEATVFWPLAEIACQAAGIRHDEEHAAAVAAIAGLLPPEPAEAGMAIASRLAGAFGLGPLAGAAEELQADVVALFAALARDGPLVAVVEDIHWAGSGLLAALEHVAARLGDMPVLVVCTARPELLEAHPGWPGSAPSARTITLEALGESECALLVAELLGDGEAARALAEPVVSVAGGNPLVVEEILAMLVDEGVLEAGAGGWRLDRDVHEIRIPPTIEAILAARLDRLSDGEREVIEQAATVGRDFDAADLRAFGGREAPALEHAIDRLLDNQLIQATVDGPADYRFHHILVRDAAYASIPKRRRAGLHERVAGHIEGMPAGQRGGVYGEIAGEHLERACILRRELGDGDGEIGDLAHRAGELLGEAGRRASGLSDFVAARRAYARGEAVVARSDPSRPELLTGFAAAAFDMGLFAEAKALAQDALDLAERLGATAVCARAALVRTRAEVLLGDVPIEDALVDVREMAQEIARTGDDRSTVSGWMALSNLSYLAARSAEAAEAADRAVALARRTLPAELPYCLVGLCGTGAHSPMAIPEASARCLDALSLVQPDTLHAAMIESRLAYLDGAGGDLQAADGRFAHVMEVLARHGAEFYEFLTLLDWGSCELLAGEFESAERRLRRARDAAAAFDRAVCGEAAAWHARALTRVGQHHEALEEARRGGAQISANDVEGDVWWRIAAALALAGIGEPGQGEQVAREALAIARRTDMPHLLGDTLTCLGETLLARGETAEAASVIEEAIAVFEAKGMVPAVAGARELLASRASAG